MKNRGILAALAAVSSLSAASSALADSAPAMRETALGRVVTVSREFELDLEKCVASFVQHENQYTSSCKVQNAVIEARAGEEQASGSSEPVSLTEQQGDGSQLSATLYVGRSGYQVAVYRSSATGAPDLDASLPLIRKLFARFPGGKVRAVVHTTRQ